MDKKEMQTLKKIDDASLKIGKSSVETTAYLRALGEEKKLNVDKHRKDVEAELEQASKDTGDN